jgi:glycosyltransferase involved in cell wall biosynthesis
MNAPRVTVLMPVFNGEAHLAGAIDSILGQTFRDFELLVIDDGSTDRSAAIAAGFGDSRVRVERNTSNLGLVRTLNRGLDMARGEYVARMDADDLSLPERLRGQVAFLDAHPDFGLCGTWVETFGEREGAVWSYPTDAEVIRCSLLFRSVLAHPTVMLRRRMFEAAGLRYDEHYPHAEDFQLWQRASARFPLANIGEVLVRYRISSASVSSRHSDVQGETLRRIDAAALSGLGISPDDRDLEVHRRLGARRYGPDLAFAREAERWLETLRSANRTAGTYPARVFEAVLGREWLSVCRHLAAEGWGLLRMFARSPMTLAVRPRARVGVALKAARAALRGERAG